MIQQLFVYGLKINGHTIVHGDTIKITKIEGISQMSCLFRIGVADEAIIRFLNHEKYNTLIMKIFLKKNGSIISVGNRFEQTAEDFKHNPTLHRRMPCTPIELNTSFANELENSNGKIYYITKI